MKLPPMLKNPRNVAVICAILLGTFVGGDFLSSLMLALQSIAGAFAPAV